MRNFHIVDNDKRELQSSSPFRRGKLNFSFEKEFFLLKRHVPYKKENATNMTKESNNGYKAFGTSPTIFCALTKRHSVEQIRGRLEYDKTMRINKIRLKINRLWYYLH